MNLFATKSMDSLVKEAQESGEHSLKRTLGPFQLTALGVGAIIGAGIFVLTGLGAHYAGPGLMLSFVLSGLGCAFAGLCYAEFAAMIPLAGSAYTYAYATLGELFAWIIGWDLTLEYAMGASTVSSGWSNHFIELLNIFNIKMPLWLAYDHWTGAAHGAKHHRPPDGPGRRSDVSLPGTQAFLNKVDGHHERPIAGTGRSAPGNCSTRPTIFGVEIGFNLPAFVIALLITAILVIGIKESARFNATIVVIKVAVVLFVIAVGIRYINTSNWGTDWSSLRAIRLLRNRGRSRLHILCLYRFRRRLHHRAGSQEPAARPAHRNHRLAAGLHRPLHPGRLRPHRHGAVARDQHGSPHRARLSRPRPHHRLPHHYRSAPSPASPASCS